MRGGPWSATSRRRAPRWRARWASRLDEIAFTRNATEAMKALILQYNRLKPGDAVLYADLDYDSMQTSMELLAGAARGAR